MPLPPALAARLAKRGLLSKTVENESQEEIIAEDYDDRISKENISSNENKEEAGDSETLICRACPNKWNAYHACSIFCRQHWSLSLDPDPEYEKRRQLMLSQYPVPEGWKDVYDPGCKRHYYWCMASDEVSWFPPGHPKFYAGPPASKFREEIYQKEEQEENAADSAESGEESESDSSSEESVLSEEDEKPRRVIEREKKQEKRNVAKGKGKVEFNDLDPMDPASYSDIPRGDWSAGLAADVKTGVDSTASGPLYQMRPYPAPGAILRAQENKKSKK
nr:EOG090X0A6P [Artemia franciscana]